MSRRRDDHYDGESLSRDSALARALMHDERTWWLSSNAMTVSVTTKKTRYGLTVITEAPPIIRGFINQPATNLERWMRQQGGFQWKRLS